jgi:hypothetical protein
MLTAWILNVLCILCPQQRGSPAVQYILVQQDKQDWILCHFKYLLLIQIHSCWCLRLLRKILCLLLGHYWLIFTWKTPHFVSLSEKYLALMYFCYSTVLTFCRILVPFSFFWDTLHAILNYK